ncbi:hypothetical protein GYMLUDRAFT_62616 [Collybiopsis luxurians FD-317 M1]|uniref:Uncharacterized protein n=1 Tax=Collybiopsis luxurians FD-317 M1 TaxID=944289 RepID=A0A0D0BKP7_9AGAR|nr:hypothetical protein GYMLUDRAFT_62616 [Collybiopsis luxurians FD-317 M1]
MSTPAPSTAPGPSTASQGKKYACNPDPQEPAGETDSCKSSVSPPLLCQLKKNCTAGNPETSGGPVSPQGSDREAQASKMKKPPAGCVVYHVFCKDIEEDKVPPLPSGKEIFDFKTKVLTNSSPWELLDCKLITMNPNSEFVHAQLMLLWEECLHSSAGSIGAKISAIPEVQKCLIFAQLASVSLTSFHPDFLGPASSAWNDLHESIALQTFEQACMNHIYEFSKQQDEHIKYLQMKKWNSRIASIIELPVCHSDDEDSPDKSCYYCLTLSLCSANAKSFVESIDTYCDSMQQEIPQKPHPTQKPSHFNKLPGPEVALDWFDPAQFNALPPHLYLFLDSLTLAKTEESCVYVKEEMKENAGDEDDDEVDWDANDEEQEEENSESMQE